MRLVLPLKKSLVAKRKALEAAMDGYKKAAEYQVAEVTHRGDLRDGRIIPHVVERSHGLRATQEPQGRRAGGVQLAARGAGVSFRGAGIKAHELNTARAKDGVYDEWVQKSFQVLAELKPARYGKTELTQDVVTSLN